VPEELPEQIVEIGRRNDRRLAKMTEEGRKRVRRVLDRAFDTLRNELQQLPKDSFRAQQARIQALFAQTAQSYVDAASGEMANVSALLTRQAGYDVAAELNAWLDHYGAEMRLPNLAAISAISADSLLRRHETSVTRYGMDLIKRMESQLAHTIATRGDRTELTDRIQKMIGRRRYAADRIARTELSWAYNNAHHKTIAATRHKGVREDIQKTAIVTFDHRTDADSYPLEGQVRDVDEDFVDGEGRRYLHPPGRPNDREKEVPYLDNVDATADTRMKRAARKRRERRADQEGPDDSADLLDDMADGAIDENTPVDDAVVVEAVDELADEATPPAPTPEAGTNAEPPVSTDGAQEGLMFPDELDALEEVGDLGGSTGAKLMRDPDTGQEFVMKSGADPQHIKSEMRADAAYQELNVPVPRFREYTDADGNPVKLAEKIEGQELGEYLNGATADELDAARDALQEHAGVDALMANWDAAGLNLDNMMIAPDGTIWRIDNGGAMAFRAQGDAKGADWNDHVTELFSMRPWYDDRASEAYRGTSIDDLLDPFDDLDDERRAAFLEAVDQDAPTARARLEELEDLAEVNRKMRDDVYVEKYRDDFVKAKVEMREDGVPDQATDELTYASGATLGRRDRRISKPCMRRVGISTGATPTRCFGCTGKTPSRKTPTTFGAAVSGRPATRPTNTTRSPVRRSSGNTLTLTSYCRTWISPSSRPTATTSGCIGRFESRTSSTPTTSSRASPARYGPAGRWNQIRP